MIRLKHLKDEPKNYFSNYIIEILTYLEVLLISTFNCEKIKIIYTNRCKSSHCTFSHFGIHLKTTHNPVVISNVKPGSTAWFSNLKKNDVIVEV